MKTTIVGAALAWAGAALAHDAWLETDAALVRVGATVEVDLKLGNHGNQHRDFLLAGRLALDSVAWEALAPHGRRHDLKAGAVATAAAPKEGYWTSRCLAAEPGLHVFAHSMDRVMKHGKAVRSIRSAKAFVLASASLDRPVDPAPGGAAKPLGLPFEIVLDTCPVLGVAAGKPLAVRVLKAGKPAAAANVCFVPRGAVLKEGVDPDFERAADAAGKAVWTPTAPSTVLIVAHFAAPDEKAAEYESTLYAATAVVRVPARPRSQEGSR